MLNSKKRKEDLDRSGASGFGGYSTRHEIEKRRQRGRRWRITIILAIFLVLSVFACFGILSIIRGDFSTEKGKDSSIGSIRVPTQSEISESQRKPEEMISQVNLSLITLEIPMEDGTSRFGTGFVISEDGYAVCAASLFEGAAQGRVTAYTGAGFSSIVQKMGVEPTTGIALIRLSESFLYTPLPAENSNFVSRGQSLYVVASQKSKQFYGTVMLSQVASVGPAVSLPEEAGGGQINIIYLDKEANASQYGAVVVDQGGSAVGFVTDKIAPSYEGLTSVVPIHSVYTLVNNMLNGK